MRPNRQAASHGNKIIRLIKPSNKIVPGSSKSPSFITRFKKSAGIVPLALILLASTFSAGQAEAGVFSLFRTVSGKTSTENSPTVQKMRILEAIFSPTLNGQGGPDIIMDESALISNNSPLIDDSASIYVPDVPVDYQGDSAIRIYVVKSGDTISTIAGKFDVSVNTIVWANSLDRRQALKVGDKLTILPVSGIQYTVRKGDTVSGIASRYGAEISDIRDYNDKTDSTLVVGEKIIIPGVELTPAKPPVVAKAATNAAANTADKKVMLAEPVVEKTIAPKVVIVPAPVVVPNVPPTIVPTVVPIQAEIHIDAVTPIAEPVFGTLVRPKTNKGDSSSFIRPLADGVGVISQYMHDKWAVDIAAPIGTPIHAAAAGTVILVKPTGYNGGYGKYVAIEHDGGIQTLYAHMSQTKVDVGDVVTQGQTIGLVGSTGKSTGPHVHYEVRGAPNNCLKSCE